MFFASNLLNASSFTSSSSSPPPPPSPSSPSSFYPQRPPRPYKKQEWLKCDFKIYILSCSLSSPPNWILNYHCYKSYAVSLRFYFSWFLKQFLKPICVALTIEMCFITCSMSGWAGNISTPLLMDFLPSSLFNGMKKICKSAFEKLWRKDKKLSCSKNLGQKDKRSSLARSLARPFRARERRKAFVVSCLWQ